MGRNAAAHATFDREDIGSDHARIGNRPTILSAIRDEAITLAIWNRPPLLIDTLAGFNNLAFTSASEGVTSALLKAFGPSARPWHAQVADDAGELARGYAAIVNAELVSVRLDRITTDSCRRFHADYVGVRLITTYVGRGTEWLDQSMSVVAASTGAIVPHRLATGAVGLFKGRKLAPNTAIIHRSPPIAGSGEERLLLVIDVPAEPDR